ncbi:MAG: orotidine-5'-phosphate decarboxylase [Pyrinomonadaceae bacterium]|nr:orotidine-5'-phosphate decarboxylase [Pyrinomonadaceae bacterium]
MNSAKNRLIVALDVSSVDEARKIFRLLRGSIGMFKIGSQLFTAAGPSIVREIVDAGAEVFLDLKFHDIPNTVAAASAEAARLGVSLFNVHASGGAEMMRRATEAIAETAARENLRRPRLLAVTVLTSVDAATLVETGISASPENQVLALATLAASCGVDGVVASGHEIEALRRTIRRENFLIVTPGVRLRSVAKSPAQADDQKRVMTPAEAVRAGADFIVAGRQIIGALDPVAATQSVLAEIEQAV